MLCMLELVEIKDQGQLQLFLKKNNLNRTKSFLDNKDFKKMKQQMDKLTEEIHISKL